MRTASLTLSVWLLAGVSTAAQQTVRDQPAQPVAGTSLIGGVVVTDERTPQPARKVRVTLNSVDRGMPGRTTTTDDAGRFAFPNLPAGRFNLTASKPGYLPVNYGAKRPERAGTPVALSDGQRIADVVMKIVRGGVITGAVRDARAQPVAGAAVRVLRYGFSPLTGEKTLSQPSAGGSGTTDDRGIYRAWDLPPGDYVVMVTPSSGRTSGLLGLEDIRRLTPAEIQRARALADPARTGDLGTFPSGATGPPLSQAPAGSKAAYAPVFFPGTTSISSAATLTLAAAEERAGVDVQIELIPTARVDGTINLPAGVTLRSLSITLTPAGAQAQVLGGLIRPAEWISRPGADQTFSFGGVTPGQYTLLAKTAATGARGGGPPDAATAIWWGMTDVVVDGRDVSVSLDLHSGLSVSGRVVLDGASPPPAFTGIRFLLVPPGSGGNLSAGPAGGEVDADGKFVFVGVTPGTYRLTRLGAFSGPWSMKSASADGRDALDAPLEVPATGGIKDLAVTLIDRPTQLAGVLQDTSGRPASDYFIIVFPGDRAYWTPGSRRVIETRPGNDGRYSVTGLPAGEYRVAALTDVVSGEWNDPEFLARLVTASIAVTLVEGKSTPLNLRLAGG
ncbi:MAG TPA: carboxypeptidase regulatory-like domain-containing protein [Vicinamibacterales bacterium]|nr:carboxypeptidase regulatory-like domain-containing protein [Vicinamibacterales bacterium]